MLTAQRTDRSAHPIPLWRAKLKQHGFRMFRRGLINDYGSQASIAFSNDVVAAIFDVKSEMRDDQSTGKNIWSGWHLVGLFWDRRTGELLAERSWIADLRTELFPTASGNFVLRLGKFPGSLQVSPSYPIALGEPRPDNLILLSPTGQELRRIILTDREKSEYEWEVISSASGKSILAVNVEDEHREYVLLDAETLLKRASWGATDMRIHRAQTISDEHLLYIGANETFIGTADGPLDKIGLPNGWNQFLRDDMILTLARRPLTIAITKTSGERLVSFELVTSDRDAMAHPPFVSADGRRFGTVITGRRQSRIFVWEVPENQPIFVIPVKYLVTQITEPVLSPDGSNLAFINNGEIFMYALP